MIKRKRAIIALAISFALLLQYTVVLDSFFAYADDGQPVNQQEEQIEQQAVTEPAVNAERDDGAGTETNAKAKAATGTAKAASVKAAAGPITVTLHLYSWDENGEYTVVKDVKKTVSSGGRLYVTLSSYVVNKDVEIDGKTYHATSIWKADDGSTVNSMVSMKYDDLAELAGDGNTVDLNYRVSYRTDIQLSLYFKDIRHADGTTTEAEKIQTIAAGNGAGFSKKTIESLTGLRTGQVFSYAGYEYTYTGEWQDEDGNIFDASSTITFYNREGESSGNNYYVSDDVTITLSPVWEAKMIQGLDYRYIDNISTGSGSWSNKDAYAYRSQFGSLKHTFKNPEDASPTLTPNYSFRYWQTDEWLQNGAHVSSKEGKKYNAGDTMEYVVDSGLPEGTETEVNVYAYWQPSVTVRYHYDGNVVEAERFEDIAVYDGASDEFAEEGIEYSADGGKLVIDGEEYIGWYDEEGNKLDSAYAYDAPAITKEPVERTVYDVYAKRPITVKAADNTWVYDGTEHSDDGVSVTEGTLLDESDVIEAKNTGLITDAGTAENEVGELTITRDGKDITSYYEITYEKGTLTVTKAPLTVTTQSATKVYDGAALTRPAATVSGLVNGEKATATGTGSQTAVGSSRNGYKITWNTASASNYEVVKINLGTLTVTAAPVPVPDTPGGGTPVPGGGTPAAGGTNPVGPAAPATVITDNPTPQANIIDDGATPAGSPNGAWALLNLIAAALTAIGAIVALFRRKEDEEVDENQEANTRYVYEDEEEDEADHRGANMMIAKILGVAVAVISVILFILTEDMSLPMTLIDKWTLPMILLLAGQIGAALANKKASEYDEDDEEEMEKQYS
jgi:hypothetical protein